MRQAGLGATNIFFFFSSFFYSTFQNFLPQLTKILTTNSNHDSVLVLAPRANSMAFGNMICRLCWNTDNKSITYQRFPINCIPMFAGFLTAIEDVYCTTTYFGLSHILHGRTRFYYRIPKHCQVFRGVAFQEINHFVFEMFHYCTPYIVWFVNLNLNSHNPWRILFIIDSHIIYNCGTCLLLYVFHIHSWKWKWQ
jgi:hypothetical protein